MQIVIEIPKDAYDYVMGCGYFPSNFNMIYEIRNGTPIPDNATVCDIEQIRAEIDGIEINGQIDEHTMFIRTGEQVKQMALNIIDHYTK